jgi:hypothetical protein
VARPSRRRVRAASCLAREFAQCCGEPAAQRPGCGPGAGDGEQPFGVAVRRVQPLKEREEQGGVAAARAGPGEALGVGEGEPVVLQQGADGFGVQRPGPHHGAGLAKEVLHRGAPGGGLALAHGEDQQQRGGTATGRQTRQPVQRDRVGPLDVVDQEGDRDGVGRSLAGRGGRSVTAGQGRVHGVEGPRRGPGVRRGGEQPLGDGAGHRPVRTSGAGAPHQEAVPGRAFGHRVQERRPAAAGRADHHDGRRGALPHPGRRPADGGEAERPVVQRHSGGPSSVRSSGDVVTTAVPAGAAFVRASFDHNYAHKIAIL